MQTKIVTVILSISLMGLVLGTAISQENETAAMAISIAEATVCREVVDRAPVGAEMFSRNDVERLYCFVRVQGADTEIEIQHKWYYQGELVATVALPVRSDNWRTYSSKRIGPQIVRRVDG